MSRLCGGGLKEAFERAAGVHPKIVQERVGHSTIDMTMDTHSHVLPGMHRQAAIGLEERLLRGRGQISGSGS